MSMTRTTLAALGTLVALAFVLPLNFISVAESQSVALDTAPSSTPPVSSEDPGGGGGIRAATARIFRRHRRKNRPRKRWKPATPLSAI